MRKFTTLLMLLLLCTATLPAQTVEYPFTITTDASKPVLYYIYTGRDGNGGKGGAVFYNETPYGGDKQEVCLAYPDPRNPLTQFWYFMEAEDGKLKIISAEDGKIITVANTNDAPKCTAMQSESELTNAYNTWTLDYTNGYYAFKTADGRTFLSHNGNWATGGNRMGLYNADGSRDEGSRVFFEPAPEGITAGIIDTTADAYGDNDAIYDLTGRKIDEITKSGIYIIGGKKVFVK